MRSLLLCPFLAVLASSFVISAERDQEKVLLYPDLQKFIERRIGEFDQIPEERRAELRKIALFVKDHLKDGRGARLVFICTHNSRRSHMGQIWAAAAAGYYKVGPVATFSGGTEATAFNARAVAAMHRAGFRITKPDDGKNPHYTVRFQETDPP